MGEGADRVRNGSPTPADVGRVAGEIDVLRRELGGLVSELDRRRHEALDVRLQLKRHPILVGTVVVVAALVVSAAITLTVHDVRRRRRPATRAREVRDALGRLLEHPRQVASQPSISNKVATAVGVAIATALVRRMLEPSIPHAPQPAR
jgi:hypothetical protein